MKFRAHQVSVPIAILDVTSVLMLQNIVKCANGIVTLHLEIVRAVTIVALAADIVPDPILDNVQFAVIDTLK
jgi:hypothetical protein